MNNLTIREADFSAWLARIVSNHCLMLLRVRRRARFLHLDAAPPGSSRRRLDLPSWRLDPEGEAGNRQLREVLDQEIRRIPSLLREAVLLSDVQELPIGEVASRLGISVSAAKSRLLRARVELRQRILRHCGRSGRASLTMRVSPQPERLRAC
jgi:RNA polymerase sigma-70 factor (ECF subfamily)